MSASEYMYTPIGQVILRSLVLQALIILYTAIHRLYFSPISKFPGPKLAALTLWYEFYYDIVLGGQYAFHIENLHAKYGPIVRISPKELHCSDPDFYDEVYAGSSRKRDKWAEVQDSLGISESLVATAPHDHHRLRRSALNPFFSKASVRSLQPLIDTSVNLFMQRISEFQVSGEEMTISHAFAALANDIVTEYAFGFSYNRLTKQNFDPEFHDNMHNGVQSTTLIRHNPWIPKIFNALPISVASFLNPHFKMFNDEKADVKKVVEQVISRFNKTNGALEKTAQRTIFTEILNSKLPPHEKTAARLGEDAIVTVSAGTFTTAWTLSVAAFFLLTSPTILEKLKSELEVAIPDPSAQVSLSQVENLPYLGAIVSEALRLSYGVAGRVQRIAPTETLVLRDGSKEWYIPPGTPVSMMSTSLHHNETIFPDSKEFKPERWLDNPGLQRYLVSFTKGSRQCLGINLAYAELYIVLAVLFRSYGSSNCRRADDKGVLELFETDHRDVEMVAALTLPGISKETKGIRIHVLK